MDFWRPALGDTMCDGNALRDLRSARNAAEALGDLCRRLDMRVTAAGYVPVFESNDGPGLFVSSRRRDVGNQGEPKSRGMMG